uniref:Arrestin C-terminal-like domain-containing protein n=1 Tax=Panagrolaimus davidi TaxID=227884 RepID=A0A914P7X9_9BILA
MSSLPATEVFERFDIDLDAGDDPVFHGGELITGNLKINLKKQITIKVIRIQFKGRACWLGNAEKNAEIEKVYFDKDFILLERPPGRPEPGHFPWVANFTYSLPFQCPLPKGCPTSYEGPQGFIRYFARAVLITDEVDATQYVVKKGITIISPPELHELLPPHSEPIEVEETATYGSCCCKGKVVARIELPKTAYAPGEKVIGKFTLNGKQPKQILEQIEVRLVDKVTRADIENDSHKSSKSHKSGTMDTRTIYVRKLELEDITNHNSSSNNNKSVNLTNIHLLTIPPVVPSTQRPSFPSPLLSPEIKLEPDGQVSRLLESPSTGTLKQRKKPFILINYLIQISAGNKIVLDIPITIHPIPLYENGIEFKPFAAGFQNFHEVDETDKKALNAPFKYQPKYPVYSKSPAPPVRIATEPGHEMIVTQNGDVELSRSVEISELPNGDRVILSKEEMVIVHQSPESQRHSIHKRVLPDEEPPIQIPQEDLERVEKASPSPPFIVEEVQHHEHHEHQEQHHESHIEEEAPSHLQEESYEISERKEPSPIPIVEITPSEDQPLTDDENEQNAVEEESSVVIREDENAEEEDGIARPYITSETNEENGHVITTEDFEDGDAKTHKTIETYEYTDENGVRVEVQKTTEATVVHHEEQSAH